MNDKKGMDKWKAAVAVVRNMVTCSIPGIHYITDSFLPKWTPLLWIFVVLALFITLNSNLLTAICIQPPWKLL